ncbi:hypothetical protein [Saccharothrix sp. Mg75]|uniref:hypothetical protein n=1 Tax=Saccharothrix sp. Mg75 TaxID=3445357 RepID=UPI003EEF9280
MRGRAAVAALSAPTASGAVLGWCAGRGVGAALGAVAGLAVALGLVVAVDRVTGGRPDR